MQTVRCTVVAIALVVVMSCGGVNVTDDIEDVVPSSTTSALTNGWVQVGVEIFDLVFTCYAAGAGDVVAVGVGEDSESGERVEALVQGFLGQPYLGMTVGNSIRYEASLKEPLDVYVHENTISTGAVRWERNLDLELGGGDVVGFGAVFVECASYENHLPEGY